MRPAICDLRFAICDLGPASPNSSLAPKELSLTPRFTGGCITHDSQNRFSGLECRMQTAEAVAALDQSNTPLNRRVNENEVARAL
jgi:hypothetical protein